ncbi:MAG: hypothetical protein KJP23_09715 [Deltaproteobacteria bacterium]|nr:hypothetical protein [Deltaproteobacteria bacterium]
MNFYWLKLGAHEMLFDRIQRGENQAGKKVKGRWFVEKPENWKTLTGIRNRIINVIRYGEELENAYVKSANKQLPGFSRNSVNTFLSSAMTWNRFGLCSFDCGPVLWSKKGFVHFTTVINQMNKINWPYQGTAGQLLRPLYTIALNYRRPPIRRRGETDEGFSLQSMRRRACQVTDSGIIGSKEFVAENYQRFKHLFHSKHEKRPKPIKGLDGMYSLKRLSEVI